MRTIQTTTGQSLTELCATALTTPRGRANLNLHPRLDDPIQRFFNALEPGSYVRPHRHRNPDRWEVFVVLGGSAVALTFDDSSGTVLERCVLEAMPLKPEGRTSGSGAVAVEIGGGVWHTVAALEPGTLLFELKPGPYSPLSDKDFASWAPAEGDSRQADFVAWYCRAQPGDHPPGGGR